MATPMMQPVESPEVNANVDLMLTSTNIAEKLPDDKLNKIGIQVVEGYEIDRQSRAEWERRYENALKLAAQVVESKTYPWPNAANIKYPLLTTACIQFSARAYPALIPGNNVVLARITGNDPQGQKAAAANRISQHMSYQVLEEMEEWEEDMDRLLVMLPCTGTEFKKTYYDPVAGRNISQHVLARDLVVNYWAKSLETATRKTHVLYLTPNDIRERVLRGVFLDQKLEHARTTPDTLKLVSDNIQGMTAPNYDEDAPFRILECHTWYDIDDDGYKEPYIITVDFETKKVLRISPRFDKEGVEQDRKGRIIRIKPVEYFTKFSFIPSLDGGFYDMGWGHLLGPINETVNTTINLLLDAGSLSNQQSGFLSRGIRIRGGEARFKPGEWKFVDTTGDDLRKGVVPLPVREPSNVLLQLLGTMTGAGERLSNVVDLLLGESPGQNQPATTTMAVIEQGLKVFTAVYKRLFRSLKLEYRKLYRLNKIFLPDEDYFRILDPDQNTLQIIRRSDYHGDPTDVQPAADPNMVSDAQRLMQAQALVASLKEGSPANPLEIWKRYYEALRIENPENFLPKELPPPPPDPKLVAIEMDDKHKTMEHELEKARLQIESARTELDNERLELDRMKEQFAQEMERYRAHNETQGDGSSAMEVLKMEQDREIKERELAIKEKDLELKARELELREQELKQQKEIEQMRMDSGERMATADRDHKEKLQKSDNEREVEKEEIKTVGDKGIKSAVDKIGKAIEATNQANQKTLDALNNMMKIMTAPKKVVFDKNGMPAVIKIDAPH